jgi:hypothetical protein
MRHMPRHDDERRDARGGLTLAEQLVAGEGAASGERGSVAAGLLPRATFRPTPGFLPLLLSEALIAATMFSHGVHAGSPQATGGIRAYR